MNGSKIVQNSGINIVFFGTEAFSLAALQALVQAGYTIAAVVTKPDSPSGRGMKLQAPVVKAYAIEHDIDVLQPERLIDIEDRLAHIPNRIGVLSSYGKIIPRSTLDLFDSGIINIHPSLLPKYRGPSPIETAIMNGDSETGVSLMRLVAKMDAGPVYAQKSITIQSDTNASDLYTLCAQTGSSLLIEALPRILVNELTPRDQDEPLATYTNLLNKKDALVDPSILTADQIDRHVRAYIEYPRTRMSIYGYDVIITQTTLETTHDHALLIDCADNTRLAVTELIAPSGKRMAGAAFERGYSLR